MIRAAYKALRQGKITLDEASVRQVAEDVWFAPLISTYDAVTGGSGFRPKNALTHEQAEDLTSDVVAFILAEYDPKTFSRIQRMRARARWGLKPTADDLSSFPGMSKAQQAKALGVSTSTIARFRVILAVKAKIKNYALTKDWRRGVSAVLTQALDAFAPMTIEQMRATASLPVSDRVVTT